MSSVDGITSAGRLIKRVSKCGHELRPPVNALQGIGDNAAKAKVEARKDGEFISKEDLRLRVKISKSVIGTMD
jgi:DNA polymerase III alpha subunit (gram-positive type)